MPLAADDDDPDPVVLDPVPVAVGEPVPVGVPTPFVGKFVVAVACVPLISMVRS
jgi:hypothetical protein